MAEAREVETAAAAVAAGAVETGDTAVVEAKVAARTASAEDEGVLEVD